MKDNNHFVIPVRFRNFALSGLACFIIICGFAGIGDASLEIELTLVVSGLDRPVAISHAADGSGRLFITLLSGRIVIYDGRQVLAQPFLDIRALAFSSSLIGPCITNLQKVRGMRNTRMIYSEQTDVKKSVKGIRVKLECLWE